MAPATALLSIVALGPDVAAASDEQQSTSTRATGTSGTAESGANTRSSFWRRATSKQGPMCRDATHRLVADAASWQSHPDDPMWRASTCSSPALTLYGQTDRPTGTEAIREELFVKVENGRYLPVKPAQ